MRNAAKRKLRSQTVHSICLHGRDKVNLQPGTSMPADFPYFDLPCPFSLDPRTLQSIRTDLKLSLCVYRIMYGHQYKNQLMKYETKK